MTRPLSPSSLRRGRPQKEGKEEDLFPFLCGRPRPKEEGHEGLVTRLGLVHLVHGRVDRAHVIVTLALASMSRDSCASHFARLCATEIHVQYEERV